MLEKAVEKRVFGPFSQFKKIDEDSIAKQKKELENDSIFLAMKESNQDPKELKAMIEVAMDKAFKKLKDNILYYFDHAIPHDIWNKFDKK